MVRLLRPFSICRLTVSPPYPPSLSSRSNTPVPPNSLSRFRAKLAISPALGSHFLPLFPLSLSGVLSLLPRLISHLSAWDCVPSLSRALLSAVFGLHTSPQPPPLAHPLSSHFLSLQFRSSIFLFTISLALLIPLPVYPPLLRSL